MALIFHSVFGATIQARSSAYISSFWLSNNIITQKARVLADSALELVYFHLNIDPNDFPGVVVKV